MKKLLTLITAGVLSASCAFAQLYFPERFVEAGVNVKASLSQNLLSVTDVLVEELVIDLPKIAEGMNGDGFAINTTVDADAFLNINIGKRWGFGVTADLNGFINLGLGQGLWDFLAYGNVDSSGVPRDINFDLFVEMETFAEVAVPFKFALKSLGIKVTPSLYLPLVYIPYSGAKIDISSGGGKTLYAEGNVDFNIYSLVNVGSIFNENFEFQGTEAFNGILSDAQNSIVDLLMCSGVSLGVLADYPIFKTLTVGAYAEVPILPGKMKYKTSANAFVKGEVDGVLDMLGGTLAGGEGSEGGEGETPLPPAEGTPGEGEGDAAENQFYSFDYGYSKGETEEVEYLVRKPLRLGGEVAWRPFGKWCTFRGMLGYAARNPFGEDFDWRNSMFLEYSAGVDLKLLYALRISAQSSYIDKVFSQQLGLGFSIRALELKAVVASSGTSFAKTFGLSGVTAKVGVTVGL